MSQQFLRFQEQIKTRINQARKESRRSDKAVFFFFFSSSRDRVEVGESVVGKQATLGGTRGWDKERTDSKVHS